MGTPSPPVRGATRAPPSGGLAFAGLAARLRYRDAGYGYDVLGLSPDWVARWVTAMRPVYERYFRVTSEGAERIPADGAALLAANHGGTLPVDAAMLYLDVVRRTDPPRVPRALADLFVTQLPFIGTFLSRVGVTAGTRGNLRYLLEAGELVMVFPEGVPGIGKPFAERYRLQRWRVGHAEVAIRYRVPIVPVAIIGSEEQWPTIARIRSFHLFGAPYLPIPITPVPLPVRYHLHYGDPIRLFDGRRPEDADDPAIVRAGAEVVKSAVQALVDRGLRERRGVFR